MELEVTLARPFDIIRSVRIAAHRDPVRGVIWGAAWGLVVAAAVKSHGLLVSAAGTTGPSFATLAVVIAGGLVLDGLGLFRALSRVVVPRVATGWLAIAGTLGFTALLSGLVNLDVAVVVAMPVSLAVAAERGLGAARLAVATALTANATSFLLPTSNLTTLLVLDHAPLGAWEYLCGSWLAWLLVAALTIGGLSTLICAGLGPHTPDPEGGGAAEREDARMQRLGRVGPASTRPSARTAGVGQAVRAELDLLPMFVAAAAIRALLAGGVTLHGGWLAQLGASSGLAAAVNNLPAAAAVSVGGGLSRWAVVLGLALGPNLLLSGSVASLISRRIALDHGVAFRAATFSLLGAAILPFQLLLAALGLHLTGVV